MERHTLEQVIPKLGAEIVLLNPLEVGAVCQHSILGGHISNNKALLEKEMGEKEMGSE
jgi:hypothetical protein